ncbi:hypothetical protein HK096_002546 [Nowakowskiella sp. JEL0078]|nr:hypothetical protein HK096_002546 [Nowakowskiella sp. JEL0078]
MGSIIWAIALINTVNNPESWRFTTGTPSIFWYIGEILLDSYPFQKAMAVSTSSRKLQAICILGFAPLVAAKIMMMFFREIYAFTAPSQIAFFAIENPMDAIVILLTSWSDLLCCVALSYSAWGSPWFQRGSNEFLSNLVRTTEVRIIVCTSLSVFASVMILMMTGCDTDSSSDGRCQFSGARDIAVNVVYSLYYLDYLLAKYYKVMKIERGEPVTRNDAESAEKVQTTPRRLTTTGAINQLPIERFDRFGVSANSPSVVQLRSNTISSTSSSAPTESPSSFSQIPINGRNRLTSMGLNSNSSFSIPEFEPPGSIQGSFLQQQNFQSLKKNSMAN